VVHSADVSATVQGPDAAAGVTPEFLPRCPQCDYILVGLADNRCPECGRAFQSEDLLRSRIPWERRLHIGRWRAYWRTVWQVTSSSHALTSERHTMVRRTDAERFRAVTALWLAAPLLVWWVGFVATSLALVLSGAAAREWLLAICVLPCLYLAVWTAIGVPSWFMRSRRLWPRQRDTSVALSHYAAAPLAWYPMLVLAARGIAWLGVALDGSGRWADAAVIAGLGIVAVVPIVAGIWWLRVVRLVHCIQGGTVGVVAALAVPILALVAVLLIGVALPLSFVWLALALESFA